MPSQSGKRVPRAPVVPDCHLLTFYDPFLSFCSFHVSLIMDAMDVDKAPSTTKAGKEKDNDKKRFEVKKVSKRRRKLGIERS